MKRIPFLRPHLVAADEYLPLLREIDQTRIYSNFGPLNSLFERRIIDDYFGGAGAATTVNNATIGLMLCISAMKRPGGRLAVMPSFTFAATPQAALWSGLEPYFVDVRADDWCVDDCLLIDAVRRLGDQVAVVVPYATFGTALDLSPYRTLQESGVPVVVDAAASFGTQISGRHIGQDFPGAIVFSFHATKAFGIGEGGLVYSGDRNLIEKVRQMSNFGFSIHRESTLQGLNAKLPEYAAAIGLATLDRFPEMIKQRQAIHSMYLESLDRRHMLDGGWRVQKTTGRIAFQFMPLLAPHGHDNRDHVARLSNESIEARTYFSPACHQHKLFASAARSDLNVTERVSSRILSLPLSDDLDSSDIDRIVDVLDQR